MTGERVESSPQYEEASALRRSAMQLRSGGRIERFRRVVDVRCAVSGFARNAGIA